MSRETNEWLNTNILIGYTEKRGSAWWADGTSENNHFPGAVPLERVEGLFSVPATSEPVYVQREMHGGAEDGQLKFIHLPDRQAVVTGETVHGIFKESYVIHQYNEWLTTNVSNILDDTLQIGSAGLLQNGGVAWVSVEVPENIITPEGVEFRPHLFAATSLNGTLSTTYKRVVTNVVCDNTMGMALSENGQQIKIKHSRYSALRLSEARDALNIIHTVAEDFAAEVKTLSELSVSDAQWDAFLASVNPIPEEKGQGKTMAENKREELTRLYRHDNRVAPWQGTGWGVLQAINTYDHWSATVRGKSREERNMTAAVMGGFDKLDGGTLKTLDRVLAAA